MTLRVTAPPAELEGFTEFLDAQPPGLQNIYQYCLCLIMVEADKIELVDTRVGEEGVISVFRSSDGQEFDVVKPKIYEPDEERLVETLRKLLRDEGLLDDE
jgi:hypothetical protein